MGQTPDLEVGSEPDFPAPDYPGPPAPYSGLLRGGVLCAVDDSGRVLVGSPPTADRRSIDEVLTQDGLAAIADRTPVVAIGSNGSPGVMHRKMDRAGASTTLPMVRCRVRGIGVGHSAHRSARGYIPAAPFLDPTAAVPAVISWLDDAQLDALDLTEPNYRRLRLSTREFPLTACCDGLDTFDIYDSRWGVLRVGGSNVALTDQRTIEAMVGGPSGLADWGHASGLEQYSLS